MNDWMLLLLHYVKVGMVRFLPSKELCVPEPALTF